MPNKPEKKICLALGNDPHTITSYGILIEALMRNTADKIQWNLVSQEYEYGIPEIYPHYIRWRSGKDNKERDSEVVPRLVKKLSPDFLFTIGDIQYFNMIRRFVRKVIPWIAWFPIDNHDRIHLIANQFLIHGMDIPICMSKFGRDMCLNNDIKVKNYIYPFIKSSPTKNEVKRGLRGEKIKFQGYRPLRQELEKSKEIQAFKKQLNIEEKDILLFVGRPGWRKNLQFLVSAFRKLIYDRERKNLVLYCHTDINDPSATVNLSKELHAHEIPEEMFARTQNFEWDKGIPPELLNQVYNMATIQVSTHGGEGFGMPLAEGMAAELTFVAPDCTTTPELSGNGKRGLGAKISMQEFDMGVLRPYVDLDDFCDKVETLLDSPSLRERMGKAGREWVRNKCSYPVITEKWLSIFDKIDVNRAIPLEVIE